MGRFSKRVKSYLGVVLVLLGIQVLYYHLQLSAILIGLILVLSGGFLFLKGMDEGHSEPRKGNGISIDFGPKIIIGDEHNPSSKFDLSIFDEKSDEDDTDPVKKSDE